jgi:hypothetical protein
MKANPWRVLAAAGIIAAGLCFGLGVYIVGLSDKNASERDFIEYWAAGQQLAHGANPYDFAGILQRERAAGFEGNEPRITLSPPIVLLLVLPLGYVGPKTGLILWLLVLLAGLLASIGLLWRLHGSPPSGYHWIGMAFAPTLACLMAGQISIFLLLSVVLFLYWHQSRPWLAGAILLPCVLKPHLFLSFAVALLLWMASRRSYRVLAGFAAALAASCALTQYLDRHAWSEYAQLSHSNNILHLFVPTLSECFRFFIDRNAVWLQFIPAAASCVWAVWYFQTRRDRWKWMEQGLLVLLVSAVCAPYAFFYDESMLLPAVLAGIYCAADSRRSLLPLGLIAGVALVEVFANVQITSPYYLWTPLAWLAWYLYATWNRCMRTTEDQGGEAEDALQARR